MTIKCNGRPVTSIKTCSVILNEKKKTNEKMEIRFCIKLFVCLSSALVKRCSDTRTTAVLNKMSNRSEYDLRYIQRGPKYAHINES